MKGLEMEFNTAFGFVPIDKRRTNSKPRKSGITMVSDYQLGLASLSDLIEVAGHYIDLFKIATGTSRLFEKTHLQAKIEMLRANDIRPFLGGQFQEYVLHTMGFDAMPRHLSEAQALGFDIIEISDNMVQLGQGLRPQLFDMVRDQGMTPVGEIGDKRESSSIMSIVDEVNEVLEMGAEFALIEAAELMHGGVPNEELILAIRQNVDITRCIFELATPRVGSTTVQIYAGKKFLVKTFGPDVNLGNVTPDVVIETETTRLGLGSAGPLDFLEER